MGEQKELSADGVEYLNTLDPRKLQSIRTAFVATFSSLPEEITLEMRISSVPDLACKAHGRLSIVFVIIGCAGGEDKVKEQVMASYLSFMNLLSVYFPEGEFLPVTLDNPSAIIVGLSLHGRFITFKGKSYRSNKYRLFSPCKVITSRMKVDSWFKPTGAQKKLDIMHTIIMDIENS